MRCALLVFLSGIAALNPGSATVADDAELGTHELTGPVKVLWEARYDDPGSVSDSARSIAVSPDGSTLFVTGTSADPGTGNGDYATVAYDTNSGNEIWVSRYGGAGSRSDSARSIAVSPDGSTVFVTGFSGSEYSTVAYNANMGDEIWVSRYNGPAPTYGDFARWMAVSPDGGTVFVTGSSDGIGTESDFATVAYNANTGIEIWVSRYDGPRSRSDGANWIAVRPDGRTVFVTGRSSGLGTGYDYATVAYDANTGDEIWVSRYDGPASEHEQARSIAVSPDGDTVFVTGSSGGIPYGPFGGYSYDDYATVAYDADTGDEIWVSRYDGPGSRNDRGFSIAVGPDGRSVFVTGHSGSDYSYDYYDDCATVAYDANTGDEIWVSRYDGPASAEDGAVSIATSPDARTVFVTGHSEGIGTKTDFATIAYHADTGIESWVSRYDGPASGQDGARPIVVSPGGDTVFVAGYSKVLGHYREYATVAYALVVPVEIDIRPGRFPNRIHPRSRGVVPVTLLGGDGFRVGDVDVTTLRFGPDEAAAKKHGRHIDVNFDGIMDLVVHFRTQDTGISCGDESASLEGQCFDGRFFEGADEILTVGCRRRGSPRPGQETR